MAGEVRAAPPADLVALEEDGERRRYFQTKPELLDLSTVEELCRHATRLTASTPEAAGRIVDTAEWIATRLDDDRARGLAARARGNQHLYSHDYQRAMRCYEEALASFERAGDELGAAITRSVGIGGLSHLGQYERAHRWAAEARQVLERRGERLRLARLDFNLGHVKARQDRFAEALEHFEAGYEEMRRHGEPRDVGWALRNLAVCYQDLNDFEAATRTYAEALRYLRRHGLRVAALEAEYNLAYLYYLRGQYTRALQAFEAARLSCEEQGDRHHKALCDLDQAEVYLELNLLREAESMAVSAFDGFAALGMEYETGKALAYRALAAAGRGESEQALRLLESSRDVFERQDNRVWTGVVDLYRARVLADDARLEEAWRLARLARAAFGAAGLPTRIAACEIFQARLALRQRRPELAGRHCRAALHELASAGTPALEFQARLVAGQALEESGETAGALAAYRRAEAVAEGLRGQLVSDELKIAFGRDQRSLHEGLVTLTLAAHPGPEGQRAAFALIEKAKSRTLADLMAFRAAEMPSATGADPELSAAVAHLRQRLNWHDRRLREEELRSPAAPRRRLERLRRERRQLERLLERRARQLRLADPELSSVQAGSSADLDSVRRVLPADTMLLDFFVVRDRLLVAVLGTETLTIRPLGATTAVARHLRNLRFQLGRFDLGADYIERFGDAMMAATTAALRGLYEALIAPLRDQLRCRRLVIVPHGPLHHLPFHALGTGERCLADDFTISYAPSATVFRLCQERPDPGGSGALVIGVPDERAPLIASEARAVAATLPGSRLLLGREASRDKLIRHGSRRRIVHIATHGHFRRDNPMFSAISLGEERLNLFDLYDLRLDADLVVLSGCGTGLSEVRGSDELVGLTRGLLHAGARSLVATLWNVHDESTAELMRSFYRRLLDEPRPAEQLRRAQLELRQRRPHPFYWAPFVLIGRLDLTASV